MDILDQPEAAQTRPDAPLTLAAVSRWTPILIAVVTMIATAVWHAASVGQDISAIRASVISEHSENDLRLKDDEREIESNRLHLESLQGDVAGINRRLDVAISILERLDKRGSERGEK